MTNPCVFCGADDRRLTKEHIWGDWLTHAVAAPAGDAYAERIDVSGKGESWRQAPFAHVVRIACVQCNTGWMSRIENHAKPLVAPMANGRETRLRPKHQVQVATWVALKALVSQHQSAGPPRFVPDAHYREFYDVQRPLDTMTIWLGRLGRPLTARFTEHAWYFTSASAYDFTGRVMELSEPPPDLRRSVEEGGKVYGVQMNVGPLLMMVMGHQTPGVQGYVNDEAYPHFERIWPVTGHFRWPPTVVDTLGDNADLFRFFGFMGYGPPPESTPDQPGGPSTPMG